MIPILLAASLSVAVQGGAQVRRTSRGTFTNPEAGTLQTCTRLDIRGGRIAKQVNYFDQVAFLRQVGFFDQK
ncbi:MAG: hypothetical protein Q8927_10675 [Bacteroidota bacterium]|nr:hypothetical protein [Bacteroidota bacterium]